MINYIPELLISLSLLPAFKHRLDGCSDRRAALWRRKTWTSTSARSASTSGVSSSSFFCSPSTVPIPFRLFFSVPTCRIGAACRSWPTCHQTFKKKWPSQQRLNNQQSTIDVKKTFFFILSRFYVFGFFDFFNAFLKKNVNWNLQILPENVAKHFEATETS